MVMSYDFHGAWDSQTGINAPLRARQNADSDAAKRNVEWAVQEWLRRGCPRRKLIVGLATYGRSFTLLDAQKTEVGAPAIGPGRKALHTGDDGFMAYYEICDRVKNQGWTAMYDAEQEANYAFKGDQWIGYDSVKSLQVRVEKGKKEGEREREREREREKEREREREKLFIA